MIGEPTPLIYETDHDIYTRQGINFSSLKHLDTIGLISFESLSGYRKIGFRKNAVMFYYGRPTVIEFAADEKNELETGHTLLTNIGQELVPICGSKRNDEFYDYVIRKWFEMNLITSSLLINKS